MPSVAPLPPKSAWEPCDAGDLETAESTSAPEHTEVAIFQRASSHSEAGPGIATELAHAFAPEHTEVAIFQRASSHSEAGPGIATELAHAFNIVTAFSDDESGLLRATPLYDILCMGAAALQSCEGSASTYTLSKPVDAINMFLSHNWSVSRRKKFLALAWYFNLSSALLTALLAAHACFFLQAFGVLPLAVDVLDAHTKKIGVDKVGMFSQLVTVPTFLFTLLFKHDLLRLVINSPTTFLDKTCIHQTDPVLQQQGIMKLGAFLKNSTTMLILYSDIYLRKLWTTYEVACFLAVKSNGHMQVLHVEISSMLVTGVLVAYFIFSLWWIPGIPRVVILAAVYGSYTVYFANAVYRRGNRELASTYQQLADFEVRETLCFDENDRPKVEANIAVCMRSRGYAAMTCTTEEALEAFNDLVKVHVLAAMKASLGTRPIPYVTVASIFLLCELPVKLDEASGRANTHGIFAFEVWALVLYAITNCIAYGPLCAELLGWMMIQFPHWSGLKEWAWICISGLCVITVGLFLSTGVNRISLLYKIETSTSKSVLLTAAFLLYNVVSLVTSAVVCLWRHRQKQAWIAKADHSRLVHQKRSTD